MRKGLLPFFILTLLFWLNHYWSNPGSIDTRGPASTNTDNWDYSHLSGEDFKEQAKVKIVEGLQAEVGVNLKVHTGHVYGPSRSVSMCDTYSRLSLVFRADGYAISGEPFTMSLAGPCSVGSDLRKTENLGFTIAELKSSEPVDGPLSFGSTQVFLSHTDGSWPDEFYLHSISFIDPNTGDAIHIRQEDILGLRRQNLSFKW